jgi:hypothetical protein
VEPALNLERELLEGLPENKALLYSDVVSAVCEVVTARMVPINPFLSNHSALQAGCPSCLIWEMRIRNFFMQTPHAVNDCLAACFDILLRAMEKKKRSQQFLPPVAIQRISGL